jgi:hypothetical protein
MIVGRNKRTAEDVLNGAAQHVSEPAAPAAAMLGIGYALLELAFQIGRLADQAPVYGPPEER